MKKKLIIGIAVLICVLVVITATMIYIKVKEKKNNTEEKSIEVFESLDEEDIVFEINEQDVNTEQKEEGNKKENEKEIKNLNNEQATPKPVASSNKYYIKINNAANVVTIYEKDENGEYNNPVKAMICSTGTATPASGKYPIKYRWTWLKLFGNVWGHYVTQINGNILFHSVPYLEKAENTLEYWEYDKLGTRASMGCIRLKISDAKWIYENIPSGTIVEFYSDTNPGPLGKPSAMKISDNVECRNWDPTDPNINNPWNNQKVEEVPVVEEQTTPTKENIEQDTQNNEVENIIGDDETNNTIDEPIVEEEQNELINNQVEDESNEVEENEVNEIIDENIN